MNLTCQNILAKYEERIAALGFKLYDFLVNYLDDIKVEADVPANIISFSYGPGYENAICVIIPSKKE
jgi:hypothetical protein